MSNRSGIEGHDVTRPSGKASAKRVVAGFDRSQAAQAAVDYAAEEARRRGVTLEMVHAFTWPLIYPPLSGDFDPNDPLPRVRAGRILNEAAERVRTQYPGVAVTTRLVDGHASAVLVDRSREAGLLVVGHRGEGGFAELLAGSVAIHTSAHAHCPVVVVRGEPGKPDAPVVVGVDGSVQAAHAMDFAFAAASARGAPVVAIAVWPEQTRTGYRRPPDSDPLLERLGGCLAQYPDVVVRTEIMHDRSPAAALIRASRDAGLVVVGSRGLGGLGGLLLGSVGRALIEHAPCPVAIVRTPR